MRTAATASGDIAVADAVLGGVVAAQGLLLRSRWLVAGGLLCAALSVGFGLVLDDELARQVVISLTSRIALTLAAAGVVRARGRARPWGSLGTA